MKKVFIVVLVLSLIGINPLFADEKTQKALAEELLGMMDVQASIEKSFEMIKQMQLAQLQNLKASEEQTAFIQSLSDELMKSIAAEMSWEKLKGEYIQIYLDTFSEEELQGILDFYQTPIGLKLIEKSPELMRRSMQVSQQQMQQIMPKVQEKTEEMVEKIKQKIAEKKDQSN